LKPGLGSWVIATGTQFLKWVMLQITNYSHTLCVQCGWLKKTTLQNAHKQ